MASSSPGLNTPTHETTQSAPFIASVSAVTHASEERSMATPPLPPDLDTETTSATPAALSLSHTREPTNPEPPTTTTFAGALEASEATARTTRGDVAAVRGADARLARRVPTGVARGARGAAKTAGVDMRGSTSGDVSDR